MPFKLSLILSLSLLTLGSTAAAGETEDPRKGEKVKKICFNRSIDGFSNTSRNSVVLSAGPSRDYLVKTGSCQQLRRAQSIALSSRSSCIRKGDRLIVSDSIFADSTGIGPERCYVKAIYKWDKRATAKPDQETESAAD